MSRTPVPPLFPYTTLFRSTGMWQLDRNSNGIFDGCAVDGCAGPFGKVGNLPVVAGWNGTGTAKVGTFDPATGMWQLDRKSTRLNSSHGYISYAVFCLKKNS